VTISARHNSRSS